MEKNNRTKFFIRHETTVVLHALFAVVVVMIIGTIAFTSARTVWLWFFPTTSALVLAGLLFYFLEQIIGTRVYVDDEFVTIYYFLRYKKIDIKNIHHIDLDEYSRRIRYRGREYRVRMTLHMTQGKDIILNDNTTWRRTIAAYMFNLTESRPLSDTRIYRLYLEIESKLIYKPKNTSQVKVIDIDSELDLSDIG